jgi:hypothetical protein
MAGAKQPPLLSEGRRKQSNNPPAFGWQESKAKLTTEGARAPAFGWQELSARALNEL